METHRHHTVAANKTKVQKHGSPTEKIEHHISATNQKKEVISPSIKHYQLSTVPLYHAHYHQHMYEANGTINEYIRNRSSIRKRAPTADWLSKNISMVLEQLLMHYENSYLPTHGQG